MKTNKICAIICEYNPFHNGHQYMLDQARELSQCDFVACIMSGNFSQRGEPCILNKTDRAHLAINAGADIVLQMPTPYASSSAEVFARCGVNIATSLKNATHICFGSECGNIDLLNGLADFFYKEPKEYKILLKKYLDDGYSHPQCRLKAIQDLINAGSLPQEYLEVISSPNNILAVEYLKALKETKSNLIPITIKRKGEDYNSKKASTLASASAIRDVIHTKGIKHAENCLPKDIFPLFKDMLDRQGLPDQKLFDSLKLFTLRTTPIATMKNIFDVAEGLENRLHSISRESLSYNNFCKTCETKRYSVKRLNRVALATMLNISKDVVQKVYTTQLPFVKVLAVRRGSILKHLDSSLPLIIRNNDIPKLNAYATKICEIEDSADSLYNLLINKTSSLPYLYCPTLIINN